MKKASWNGEVERIKNILLYAALFDLFSVSFFRFFRGHSLLFNFFFFSIRYIFSSYDASIVASFECRLKYLQFKISSTQTIVHLSVSIRLHSFFLLFFLFSVWLIFFFSSLLFVGYFFFSPSFRLLLWPSNFLSVNEKKKKWR